MNAHRIIRLCCRILPILAAVALFSGFAQAGVIDFGIIYPTAGSISYAGGANPLIGIDISVDNVTGTGGTANGGVTFNLLNAKLNFTTGALTSFDANNWYFGGGSGTTIGLTGTIDVNGNNIIDAGDITGVLFSGFFGSVQVAKVGDTYRVAVGAFFDTKNEKLEDLYGFGHGLAWIGNFNISFYANNSIPPNGFTSTNLLSGDITDSVSEPASLLLMGAGLIGVAAIIRRRK